MKTRLARPSMLRIALLLLPLLAVVCSLVYSLAAISAVRADGIYASPEEGVNQRAHRFYQDVSKVEIRSARVNAHDGSNPHIWYVIYNVYANSRADGSALAHGWDHEGGGNFYLHMKDGWVMVPEGYFPAMLGFWMKTLGLASVQ